MRKIRKIKYSRLFIIIIFAYILLQITINIIGMEIEVEGFENIPDKTCVFMGNHQSILDIPVMRYSTQRTLDFVAKKELAKAPLIGYWITHVKSVTIDRDNVREGMKAINQAVNNIKDGYNFTIFPEGTRSKDGKIHEFKKGSIITDAVGVKTHFLNEAMDLLKDKDVEFVSGHPMAGRENKGYLYASKEVFQGANYILIQHEENSKSAIAMMEQFVSNLGFHSVKIMSPQAHDEIISFTSQLPHVIAVSLIDSDNQKYDTGKYIGDSYRDLTRIANINEDLWTELFFTNKNNLLKSIQGFEDQLDILKKAIKEEDADTLKAMFIESSKRRRNLEK